MTRNNIPAVPEWTTWPIVRIGVGHWQRAGEMWAAVFTGALYSTESLQKLAAREGHTPEQAVLVPITALGEAFLAGVEAAIRVHTVSNSCPGAAYVREQVRR